jgi:UDP-N-acetylglucosamine 2-epimerase (non-hydrolysing)
MKFLLAAGARPNFMKIAPLVHEFKKNPEIEWRLVHTGQHYDEGMSQVFFKDFDLPEPDYFLNAGSGSHAGQTAKIMTEFEKVCLDEKPDVVVVVGDVNSTLACSITAKKLMLRVAHVEAGLRSGDMSMPEEINRIVTDSISDYLFVTEKSGIENLRKEGKRDKDIFFVGNIMIDTLHYGLKKLSGLRKPDFSRPYAVLTLHRPSNVEDPAKFRDILSGIGKISEDMKVYFPVHPRTRKNMDEFHINIHAYGDIETMPPMSYFDFLQLWRDAGLVLTDSGGLQEETTALGIPCFTIRENTERPLTVEQGTNHIVGTTADSILNAYRRFKSNGKISGRLPDLWDGRTAERIVKILMQDAGVLINS